MTDRDKVIKGLELCKYDPDPGQENKGIHSCVKCPYYNDGIMPDCQVMFTDAIELLKKQEAKQVIYIADFIEGIEIGYCPSCNRAIVNKKNDETKFCKYCGQAVKWDA